VDSGKAGDGSFNFVLRDFYWRGQKRRRDFFGKEVALPIHEIEPLPRLTVWNAAKVSWKCLAYIAEYLLGRFKGHTAHKECAPWLWVLLG
jgi:hypothetical protein